MDLRTLKEIITIGFPAALQQMITSISNVFVQSYINVFGSDVMAAWSAYSKLDTFCLLYTSEPCGDSLLYWHGAGSLRDDGRTGMAGGARYDRRR